MKPPTSFLESLSIIAKHLNMNEYENGLFLSLMEKHKEKCQMEGISNPKTVGAIMLSAKVDILFIPIARL